MNQDSDTTNLEKQIDEMVYQFTCRSLINEGRLYGLTEEEIKIVEGLN